MTKCNINIKDGKYSGNLKLEVALSIQDFLLNKGTFNNDGYKDTNSTNMRIHLNREFPNLNWIKNGSQKPFDCYSIPALLTVENKGADVTKKKNGTGYSVKKHIMGNGTIYPSSIKVKDVITMSKHKGISEEVLESFMDVLVVGVEREKKTDKIVRYSIVDGDYWGVSYEHYCGNRDYFKAINEILSEINELVIKRNMDNKCLREYIIALENGSLSGITLALRKLISMNNPCLDVGYIEEVSNV